MYLRKHPPIETINQSLLIQICGMMASFFDSKKTYHAWDFAEWTRPSTNDWEKLIQQRDAEVYNDTDEDMKKFWAENKLN